ncbi:MAG: cation:proton antiporter [Deltaproteobacteria bacterium]|nr:cation:proton antiporter [Deltaproteobacteria bacterium]
MFESAFAEVAALLLAAALIGALALWLRQPLIIAFILVGILEGPAVLGWVTAADQIDLLAKIGIALLLFIVGLKLDLRLVRTLGPLAVVTGLGQMTFSAGIGYLAAWAFGMESVAALYVAAALAFSSTIIVVKLLSDKREIDALHGRTAVGVLIVQDVVVIATLLTLTAFGAGSEATGPWEGAATILAKAAVLLAALGIAMRYVLPALLHRLAASQELLVLFGIAWAVALAAGAETMDFSKEVGAFLAGVSLGSTPYREALSARLVSLRDFLLLFFFIDLGAGLDLGLLGAQAGAAVVLSLLVLLGKPLIIMLILGALGYRSRTGFLTGLSLAQISEFSLILAALGVDLGHIDSETASVITLVAIITIALSTYLTLYAHPLYERVGRWLTIFERRIPHPEETAYENGASQTPDVILFGLGRYGGEIARRLRDRGWHLLGVDFDPYIVASARKQGLNVRYGDAHDPELLAHLPLQRAKWIVSTAPEREVNLALLSALRLHGYQGQVALRAHDAADAEVLEGARADLVLEPLRDGAMEAADLLTARREGSARKPG